MAPNALDPPAPPAPKVMGLAAKPWGWDSIGIPSDPPPGVDARHTHLVPSAVREVGEDTIHLNAGITNMTDFLDIGHVLDKKKLSISGQIFLQPPPPMSGPVLHLPI